MLVAPASTDATKSDTRAARGPAFGRIEATNTEPTPQTPPQARAAQVRDATWTSPSPRSPDGGGVQVPAQACLATLTESRSAKGRRQTDPDPDHQGHRVARHHTADNRGDPSPMNVGTVLLPHMEACRAPTGPHQRVLHPQQGVPYAPGPRGTCVRMRPARADSRCSRMRARVNRPRDGELHLTA